MASLGICDQLGRIGGRHRRNTATHPTDPLKTLLRDIFQCRGRDFCSPSRGVLGISDGNEGVHWNAGYYPRDGAVWLGVNLEGMKQDDWPVARLIERETSRPLLLTRYRPQVARPDKVTVLWSRDAWQYSARHPIKEANIAPTPVALDRLRRGWRCPGLADAVCGNTEGRLGVRGHRTALSHSAAGCCAHEQLPSVGSHGAIIHD